MYVDLKCGINPFPAGADLVGRGPTSAKNGRLGDITMPGFVPLQEFCSPIRLQPSSVCLHWPTYGM